MERKYKMKKLTLNDQIALCAVAVMGREVADVAYKMARPQIQTENQTSFRVMLSRWLNDEKAKAFVNSVREGHANMIMPTAKNDLTTREGLIDELVRQTRVTSGKESISGLQTLAKLQGFDKPDEGAEGAERRTYVLRWLSKCRNCALMKLYFEVKEAEGLK